MRELFVKLRRNLLLVSKIILFINIAGGKISKINLLGNIIEIADPHIVTVSLFLGLLYLAIRYFQYMHSLEDLGFSASFEKSINQSTKKLLIEKLESQREKKKFSVSLIGQEVEHFSLDGGFRNCSATIYLRQNNGAAASKFHGQKITKRELIIPYVKATFYVTFKTHLVSEYVFPVVYCMVTFLSFNALIALQIRSLL